MHASEQGDREDLDENQPEPFPSLRHDDADESSSKGLIPKAKDELEKGGLEITILRRLDAMGQRHQRIEDMLSNLSQNISGFKAPHS
jgi:hypothetical protein